MKLTGQLQRNIELDLHLPSRELQRKMHRRRQEVGHREPLLKWETVVENDVISEGSILATNFPKNS